MNVMDTEMIKSIAESVNNVAAKAFQSGKEQGYKEGYEAGLKTYAWWKDGVQYVGTCGTTLKEALKGQQ